MAAGAGAVREGVGGAEGALTHPDRRLSALLRTRWGRTASLVLRNAANLPHPPAGRRSNRLRDTSRPYGQHVNPNRKQHQYRRPSAFPWWLWVVAPLAVIGVVGVLLVIT